MFKKIEAFDHHSIQNLSKIHNPFWVTFFKGVTSTGYTKSWAIIVLTLFALQHFRFSIGPQISLMLQASICTFISYLVGIIIKAYFRRRRPAQVFQEFKAKINSPKNDSFPSGHASSWTSFTVALALLHHPWSIYFAIWTALIVFSRFYLGVHFPSDLIGGILLGVACGLLILFITSF